MTHEDLLRALISIHAAVCAASLGAFYRYGDKQQLFQVARDKITATLHTLRRHLAGHLSDTLKELFKEAGSVPSIIVSDEDRTYIENRVNIVEGEGFRQALSDFMDTDTSTIVDYRVLVQHRRIWRRCQNVRSWTILVVAFWQLLALGMTGVLDMLLQVTIPKWLAVSTLAPSSLGIVAFVVLSGMIMYCDDVINELHEKYDDAAS